MIDGLTHESAHAYLFSLSLGDFYKIAERGPVLPKTGALSG